MTTVMAAPQSTDARFGHVQSVWRALDLLEALASEEPVGLVELAERAGLQPSTARRLLSTMAARGYVAQGRRSGGYLLGHRALELRSPVQRRTARLRRVARPHLERARQVCGETISLAVPVQSSVLWIDEVLGAPPVTPRVGRCAPAHAAAAGKALLATWSAAALDRLGAGGDLEAVTTRTLASPAALRDDLSLVRERGYAVEDEELEAGIVAVAAAIAVDGAAVGAIGVTGPAARLLGVGVDVLGEMASIFAGELARELARTAAPAVAA